MKAKSGAAYENTLLALLFLTFGFVFFDRLALNFLFPFISKEFDLDATHLGMLASALALTWALSGVVMGFVSDALGKRKPLLVGAVVIFSLASLGSGLVAGFGALLACRLLMGLAEGPVLPLAQSLMVAESSTARRGLNMGLLQSSAAGLLGALAGPPILLFLADAYGWRTAFYVSCIPGLILAVLLWRFVREPKAAPGAVESPREKPSLAAVLRHRNIWLSVLISAVFVTWFIVMTTFAPTYLVQARGFTPGQMGFVMTVLGAAHVFWGTAVPAISDRIGRKPAMLVFSSLSVCAPLALIFAETPLTAAMAIALTYTGLGCFVLFMATIPAETVPAGSLATALGLVMGVGELAGGFVAPTLAGIASDRLGPTAPFWISAVGAALAAVFSLFLTETAPSRRTA